MRHFFAIKKKRSLLRVHALARMTRLMLNKKTGLLCVHSRLYRLETADELALLQSIYADLRLYVNSLFSS